VLAAVVRGSLTKSSGQNRLVAKEGDGHDPGKTGYKGMDYLQRSQNSNQENIEKI
jgi:hypothetical protein